MDRWLGRPGVTRLDLAGLAEPETARLATLVARAAVEADDARRIHERTAGNPLFVGETVRAYLEDGTLERRDGRVALAEDAAAHLPLTLRAVLGARIDALESDARAALEVAAVIGIWFRPSLVATLLEHDGRAVTESTWARLATSSMVLPAEPDGETWRFAHALIHDAAYAGMLASRRRRLHERVADHLESRPGSAAAGHIGMHRAAAGDVERALPLLREAAGSAMALGAADESARLWRRAADLAEPSDPEAAAADRQQAVAAAEAASALREAAGLEGR
jgi:predicted ATPase